jgi:hypothetical protein
VPRRRVPQCVFEAWWECKSKLWADGVVTISTVPGRGPDIGCPPERVVYILTGAAVERIHLIPPAQACLKFGLPQRQIVGFIGMGQSDLEIILRAQQQLPELWLMVARPKNPGARPGAPVRGGGSPWQTGFVPDDQVSLYLACADISVPALTDRAEPGRLPNKMLDYMAAGRP